LRLEDLLDSSDIIYLLHTRNIAQTRRSIRKLKNI
jgi:hypothetical protein